MKLKQITALIALCLLIQQNLFCQNQRFSSGIIFGLNFSELEGDEITDYYGINAGIFGAAKISKNVQLGIEFLFSQNGEYVLPEYYPPVDYGNLWLNHIEIPIHVDWLIKVFKKEKFHDLNFNLGIAYTRIIGYSAESIDKEEVTEQIIYKDRNAYLFQTGILYNFTKSMGLNLKASLPMRAEELDWTLAA